LIEFTSARKKMSVIVKNDKNEVFMFTKGADDILGSHVNKKH